MPVPSFCSAIDNDCGCKISREKAALVSSSKEVALATCKFLGPLAGIITDRAVNLGIDDAGGRPRRAARRGAKFRVRVDYLKKRTGKLTR
eukprot:7478344-Pyramimonas_sp.AAC.1